MKKQLKLSLFLKITVIIFISLIVTNLFTVVMATQVTQRLFVDSFTILNGKIIGQIATNFNDYTTQVVSVMNAYRQNPALKECFTQQITDQKRLYRLYYQVKSSLQTVENVGKPATFQVVSAGGNEAGFVSSGEKLSQPLQVFAELPVTKLAMAQPDKLFYGYSGSGLTASMEQKPVILAVKRLTDPYTAATFGMVYISIAESEFAAMYDGIVAEGNHVAVLDKDGLIISSNNKQIVGQSVPALLEQTKSHLASGARYTNIRHEERPTVLIAAYLPVYDVYLVNLVDRDYVLSDFLRLRPLILGFSLLVMCAILPLLLFVTRRITRPLTGLVMHMRSAKAGHFVPVEEISGSYEVRELQQVYNAMLDEIDLHVNNLLAEQGMRRKSEINALQMQINPHFLYNTLASIKYLSWQGEQKSVTDTINALIVLLQNTISKTDEKITVEEELQNLKNYVTINHTRYGTGIDVAYHVEPDCLPCKVPKLVLQPFVENAFFHGYQRKQEGCIRIFIRTKGDDLLCEVIDDGDGIPSVLHEESRETKKNHFSGIGVRNVDERLKLLYGVEYGVRLTSREGVGTTVTILMKQELE